MSVLCTNCAHCVAVSVTIKPTDPSYTKYSYECNSPNLASPVTGNLEPVPAAVVRRDMSKCGLEGRWFEAKPLETPPMPPSIAA